MAVERLDSTQELFVVPAVDEDLRVVLDAVREDPERAGVELLLLLGVPLLRSHISFGHFELEVGTSWVEKYRR